jgi:antitoxin YokJ
VDVSSLVERVRMSAGCVVLPSTGPPRIKPSHLLPTDLAVFYQLCGGMVLYGESEYPVTIVSSEELVLANPVIVRELCEWDISACWYIVAQDKNKESITIDLAPERLGRCYDSFYERHGVRGSCPIIAKSFAELLGDLVNSKGEYYFWLLENFKSFGDAYD